MNEPRASRMPTFSECPKVKSSDRKPDDPRARRRGDVPRPIHRSRIDQQNLEVAVSLPLEHLQTPRAATVLR